MLSEALCWHSELSSVCGELYEGPGGNQVDGLLPATVASRGLVCVSLRRLRPFGAVSGAVYGSPEP